MNSDDVKKRNPVIAEYNIDMKDDPSPKRDTPKNYSMRRVFDEEEQMQFDQEKTMTLSQRARYFAILFSLMNSILLFSYIIEEISHPKDSPKYKAQKVLRFIFVGALALLTLIQIVFGCLYTMWPLNMLVERILLMYSSSITGAVIYSIVFQLLTDPQ